MIELTDREREQLANAQSILERMHVASAWECPYQKAGQAIRYLLARDAEARGKVAVSTENLHYLKWSAEREANELRGMLKRNPDIDRFKTDIVIANLSHAIADAEAALKEVE